MRSSRDSFLALIRAMDCAVAFLCSLLSVAPPVKGDGFSLSSMLVGNGIDIPSMPNL